jgi:radical SAM protein with 4Fe4S-binding SPASM domain
MNALDEERNTLSDNQIKQILSESKELGITAIEWLGGEPLLRRSIFKHMETAQELGFRNNVWTGGLPLGDEHILKKTIRYTYKGLIAIHVSSINPKIYKKFHPSRPKDDLRIILSSIKNLLNSGYPASQVLNSVTFTGLQTSEDMIKTIDYFEKNFNIKTSLNIYHTYLRSNTSNKELLKFIPSKEEVIKVYERYNKQWGDKPLPMNCVNKQYCSATVSVLCDGSITSCATIRKKNAPNIHKDGSFIEIINKNRNHLIFKKMKENPLEECSNCPISDRCWGCRSRAFAARKGIYGSDPRCFRSH